MTVLVSSLYVSFSREKVLRMIYSEKASLPDGNSVIELSCRAIL